MVAWYNEPDPYAADWLENLIAAGEIAYGVVDRRSVEDVTPNDLKGFIQCHFFAGIGGWSEALRIAGWPDDRPVWTGSCPCQPFSSAGKGAGVADERHLWPAWYYLIGQCKPVSLFGEQVASKDGLGWLDIVHADLEAANYAVGAFDICAASVGAPHMRQRQWIVADANGRGRAARRYGCAPSRHRNTALASGGVGRMADSIRARLQGYSRYVDNWHQPGRFDPGSNRSAAEKSAAGLLDDSVSLGCEPWRPDNTGDDRIVAGAASAAGGMAYATGRQLPQPIGQTEARNGFGSDGEDNSGSAGRAGPVNGYWRDADWLLCRDGKWRPVEPGTLPLAHGVSNRVGRLRAFGNAIVPQVAAEVIKSYMEHTDA